MDLARITLLAQNNDAGGQAGAAVGMIVYAAVVILMIVALWKVFEKAGKPGWAAIIPIYNTVVILEIVGRPIWWILLMLIPCVNFIIAIVLMNDLSRSFGKGVGYTLGLIFLPFIFIPLLGFGDARYAGPVAATA